MTLDEAKGNIGGGARYTPPAQFMEIGPGLHTKSHIGTEEVTISGVRGSFVVVSFIDESKALARPSRLEPL